MESSPPQARVRKNMESTIQYAARIFGVDTSKKEKMHLGRLELAKILKIDILEGNSLVAYE
jgi:hypothetical protein